MGLYDKPQYVTPVVAKLKEFFGKALHYLKRRRIHEYERSKIAQCVYVDSL